MTLLQKGSKKYYKIFGQKTRYLKENRIQQVTFYQKVPKSDFQGEFSMILIFVQLIIIA